MTENQPLKDKVALITSSSPGTCADIARQLAGAGAKVVVCGRNANRGLATVRQIRKDGGRATFVLADIAVIADVRAMIDEAIATYGRLDILINNVSNSYAQDALMPDVSESVWDRIIEPLLKGTFFCCQLSIPFLQQCEGGTIINLIERAPELQGRSVSKICQGGVVAMTSAITQQFITSNVTANLIWATPAGLTSPEDSSKAIPEAAPDSDDTSLNLLVNTVMTSPAESDRPFTTISEAVMYLTQHGHTLQGAALRVYVSESVSESPASKSEPRPDSGSEAGSSSSTRS